MGTSPAKPAAPRQDAASAKPRSGKVAVIAVHGVAYHAPGASANSMAELLLSLPAGQSGAPRTYTPFEGEAIHIPLRPVRAWAASYLRSIWKFTQERSSLFAAGLRRWAALAGGKIARGRVGHEFSRLLLQDYQGGADGNTFVTTRLKGRRSAGAPGGAAEVHIFEAYWADLARPENTVGRFFSSVFQLLMHLGSLSRLAIDVGSGENPGWQWRIFQKSQEYAVRILQLPIPVLNLILFIAGFSVLPRLLPPGALAGTAIGLAGAGGIGAGILISRTSWLPVPRSRAGWMILPVSTAAAFAVVAWLPQRWGISAESVIALEWWGVGALLLRALLRKYDEVREGSREFGIWLYLISLGAFVVALTMAPGNAETHLTRATLWTMQWILAAIRAYWIAMFFWAIAACVLGSYAWRRLAKGSAERARARAAVRTSRLALALPTLLTLLLIIFLWGGLFHWVTDPKRFNEKHPLFANIQPESAPLGTWLKPLFCDPAEVPNLLPQLQQAKVMEQEKSGQPISYTPNDYFAASLVWSIGPGLAATLVVMLAAVFYLTWWVMPSVATEKIPLRDEKKAPRWSTNHASLHLGAWHSRGLDTISVVTFLLWSAVFLVITIFDAWSTWDPDSAGIVAANGWTNAIIGQTAKLTASIAVLGLIVRYTSSALGIVLDVDNYLRTSPANATPRARIMERYVSLLRHVAQYKDEQGRRYDRVVIVAHSLGSLISADLLRFLRTEGDPDLAPLGYGEPGGNEPEIPITLFTMGNPLRQLMNRFFPYLYDWMRDVPDGGLKPLGAATLNPPPPVATAALPDPGELGVEKWVSAYRSGDYVGRSIWSDEWYGRNLNGPDRGTPDESLYIVPQAGQSQIRAEMCIGAGAHQHYWDDTAKDIAEQLDALIHTP